MKLRKSFTIASLISLSSAFAGIAASSAHAAELTDLNKDLEIMGTILQTAVKQTTGDDKRGKYRVREVNSTYLAGQGAVFTMNTSGGGHSFFRFFDDDFNVFFENDGGHAPVPPAPPIPVIDSADYENVVIDIDPEELEDIAEGAIEQAHEALRNVRMKMRDLRHEEREITFEEREIQRRKRDIEFEQRRADDDRQNELTKELKELEKELAKLNSEKSKVVKIRVEMEEDNKEKAKKRHAEEAARRKQFLASFEDAIADSFCRYGSGMKSLNKKEKVNVVLQNFGQQSKEPKRSRNTKQDRIYVFNYKDIRDCVADNIDAKKLLSKAEVYYF